MINPGIKSRNPARMIISACRSSRIPEIRELSASIERSTTLTGIPMDFAFATTPASLRLVTMAVTVNPHPAPGPLLKYPAMFSALLPFPDANTTIFRIAEWLEDSVISLYRYIFRKITKITGANRNLECTGAINFYDLIRRGVLLPNRGHLHQAQRHRLP